jgi:GntR family transcriptional regulator, transcriptional repressor for pyruvate dehydrogenase complex
MEHKGLVSRVEEDLERTFALGRFPQGGLPSERVMARRYGVSRTTIRGALQGLAARGLIVKHPGRQSRTVGLDQALTLESLKLALPEEGRPDPDRRRLLEGFFALKREVTVELLVACCEHASHEDLDELKGACFALREEAHWQEDRRGWVHKEFELLRLAARAADRPGHALLIQSLEKAFRGLANRVLPHLDAAAIEQWALAAFNALVERDSQAVRQQLPVLLKAVDAPLLDPLAPVRRTPPAPTPSPAAEPTPPPMEEEALSGADRPNRYACPTSSEPVRPTEGLPSQTGPASSNPPEDCGPPPSPLATVSQSRLEGSPNSPGGGPVSGPLVSADTAAPGRAASPSVAHELAAAGGPIRPESEDRDMPEERGPSTDHSATAGGVARESS